MDPVTGEDVEKLGEQIAALNRIGRGEQVLREMRAIDAARQANVKIRNPGRRGFRRRFATTFRTFRGAFAGRY